METSLVKVGSRGANYDNLGSVAMNSRANLSGRVQNDSVDYDGIDVYQTKNISTNHTGSGFALGSTTNFHTVGATQTIESRGGNSGSWYGSKLESGNSTTNYTTVSGTMGQPFSGMTETSFNLITLYGTAAQTGITEMYGSYGQTGQSNLIDPLTGLAIDANFTRHQTDQISFNEDDEQEEKLGSNITKMYLAHELTIRNMHKMYFEKTGNLLLTTISTFNIEEKNKFLLPIRDDGGNNYIDLLDPEKQKKWLGNGAFGLPLYGGDQSVDAKVALAGAAFVIIDQLPKHIAKELAKQSVSIGINYVSGPIGNRLSNILYKSTSGVFQMLNGKIVKLIRGSNGAPRVVKPSKFEMESIAARFGRYVDEFDYGTHLKTLRGEPPIGMPIPHAHHILFKK